VALPPLTPEQRAAALEKAAKARKERAEVKNRLKKGSTTLPQVLKEGQTDDVVGKMKVSALLESMPGVGKVRAKQIMEKLGIAAAMKPKTKLTSRPVAELVAAGEAEIGLQQIVAILPVQGADLVGPLPAELQNVIIYAAGLSAGAGEPAVARAFVAFTKTPQAGRLIRAKGMEPA